MANLELVDQGCIYRNPNPGYQYHFACHSDIVQLSGDELLCAFQRGGAIYSVDSVMLTSRSTDNGKTWITGDLIHDPDKDQGTYSYHGPMLTRAPDGTLICAAFRWDRSDPEHPVFNEATGGILASDTLLFRSTDNGATWTAPQQVDVPSGMVITPSSSIVILENGRWLFSFDQWHAYDEPGPYKPRTVGLFSSDAGKTWGDPVTYGLPGALGIGHWHGRIHRMADNRLFTLFWTAELESGRNLPLHWSIGSPDGQEWSAPQPTNIPGQTNWPVDLGDGRMVAIYTVRETDPPGFYVTHSEDGGQTWDLERQLLIWDATGRDKIGISAHDSYPRSHDTISFGAPTAVVLDNGDVVISFWCTEISVTQICYARLRLV